MDKKRMGNDPLEWVGKDAGMEQPDTEAAQEKKRVGRPRTLKREITKSSQEGLKDNWTRYTVIIREDLLEDLKDYAWTDRRTMKQVINEMIEDYLKDKEIMRRDERE